MRSSFAQIMLLVTVILMDLLGGAEVDLFVPSFPELKSHFNLSNSLVEALLSINFAGFCLSLFFVGSLADRYGRKPIILIGLVIFMIGSSLCFLATSFNFLFVGRFLQGLGIAAPATLCFLIIADTYSIAKQQYFMGVLNGLMNAAVAGAPVLGSYITIYFHWQGNFIALLLFGLFVLALTIFFIPQSKLPKDKETLSLRGYLPIFRSKPLMLLLINTTCMFVPYWIFLGMSSILYIEDLGVSLAQYGYYQGAWALAYAIGSVLFGLIITKYEQKKMLYISGQICLIGLIIIAIVSYLDVKNPLIIALSLLPFGIGGIVPGVILYPIILNFIPQAKGKISALIKIGFLSLTALSLELASYCYQGSFQNIAIIMMFFIVIAIISLFSIIKNHEIMNFSQTRPSAPNSLVD